jgi:hypothetical protein
MNVQEKWMQGFTLDIMAAGTLAMMDMTGLRLSNMNVWWQMSDQCEA